MKHFFAVMLLLALPAFAFSQDVTLPDTIPCKPGRLIKVTATVTDPTLIVWWDTGGLTPGVDFDLIKLDSSSCIMLFPAELVPAGQPGAVFKIGAIVATAKNKISTAYTKVVLGSPPGPTPPVPPPVPPTPPVPAALLNMVQQGFAADGATAANKASAVKYAAAVRKVVTVLATPNDTTLKTGKDVLDAYKAAVNAALAATELVSTYKGVGTWLGMNFPTDAPLTAQLRASYLDAMTSVANALDTLK